MSTTRNGFDVVGELGALRRYARVLTRDEADAEDLVHDALVRAYEKRGSFRSGGNLKGWLLAIVHNTFVSARRARLARQTREERSAELEPLHAEPAQDDAVRLDEVRRAFLQLPDEQREALHLVAIEGLSYQEAAAALDVPVGTLMSRIGRARAALRALDEAGPAAARTAGSPPKLRIVGGSDDGTD
ncbi:sigma-70 family RNA polymerase sigma factor [Tistrella mobilis]|uniref:sigma-70 family RNA polymerase sigma factor n=1 Tax=Tistrella mobilis TaxID=171437 RepID=UPI0031F6A368